MTREALPGSFVANGSMSSAAPTRIPSAKAPTISCVGCRRRSHSRTKRHPTAGLGPLRFVLDSDRVSNPVDVVEVRDHLDGVVDRAVAPAVAPELIDVRLTDCGRLVGDLGGEIAQRAQARLEVRPAVVVGGVLR